MIVESKDNRLTHMQRKGISLVRKTADLHGLNFEENLGGEDETYVVISFAAGNRCFRVYLYDDEAGFFVDDEWRIWEEPDYTTDDRLLGEFHRSLEDSVEHALSDHGRR